jgi:osmotically inducible protein OsmC
MPTRTSSAQWQGSLKNGAGTMALGSGAFEGPYSFVSRFEEGPGTNPEELIAAAHAGCFSMALSNNLDQAGFTPNSVNTTATVHLEKTDAGQTITRIALVVRGAVPGVDEAEFRKYAETTKETCPVSRALAAVGEVTIDAALA